MADYREIINTLGIREDILPAKWETFFIASQNKYAQAEGNRTRYMLPWLRQINKWIDFSQDQLEDISRAGIRINQNTNLYEWSAFLRYIMYDTLILRDNEELLDLIAPVNAIGEYSNLFVLLSFLSGFDDSLNLYKQKGLSDEYIDDIFRILPQLMDEFSLKNDQLGMVSSPYIPRLANSSLIVFDGIGFTLGQANFPGPIYRNHRTAEQVMLTAAGQYYYDSGQRLSYQKETEIKDDPERSKLVLENENVSIDTDSEGLSFVQSLPSGVWESIFYETETQAIVSNSFAANGLAVKAPRVFEKNMWNRVLEPDDLVLDIVIPKYEYINLETLTSACLKAWHYFSREEDLDKLHKLVDDLPDISYVQDIMTASEEAEIANLNRQNQTNIYPRAFKYEGSILSPSLLDELEDKHDFKYFSQLFRKYSLPENRDKTLLDIFGLEALREPVSIWDESNEISRAAKKLAFDGDEINEAGGFFFIQRLVTMLGSLIDRRKSEDEAKKKEEKARAKARKQEEAERKAAEEAEAQEQNVVDEEVNIDNEESSELAEDKPEVEVSDTNDEAVDVEATDSDTES